MDINGYMGLSLMHMTALEKIEGIKMLKLKITTCMHGQISVKLYQLQVSPSRACIRLYSCKYM